MFMDGTILFDEPTPYLGQEGIVFELESILVNSLPIPIVLDGYLDDSTYFIPLLKCKKNCSSYCRNLFKQQFPPSK